MERIIKYWKGTNGYHAFGNWSLLPIIFVLCMLIFSATVDKKTITIDGKKYYKCFTDYTVDTTEEPNGYVIEKTSHTYYDKDKCKDVNH